MKKRERIERLEEVVGLARPKISIRTKGAKQIPGVSARPVLPDDEPTIIERLCDLAERLDKLEKAVEQEWRKRNDRIFAAESRLEARLEKLEGGAFELNRRLPQVEGDMRGTQSKVAELKGVVGEELPRLFTRIEELERVRIELEAGMAILSEGEPNEDKSSITPNIPTCQSEGDKARQPGFTPHEVAICDTCQTPVLPGEWCACGVQYDPKARQPEHTGAIVCPKCGAYGDALRTKRCQPDEPMADMPETGPSEQEKLREMLFSEREHSDDLLRERDGWKDSFEVAAAERDQARAERDRLREAAGKLASEVGSAVMKTEPQPGVYQYMATGSFSEIYEAAADLRALLDNRSER